MTVKTHYDNLKVSRTATKEEIKKAYRRLCSKHHPDKYPEKDREKQNKILIIINKAYTVLSDDVARRQHDAWIAQQEGLHRHQERWDKERAEQEKKRQEQRQREREQQEKERRNQEEAQKKREAQEKEKQDQEAKRFYEEQKCKTAKKRKIVDYVAIFGVAALLGYGFSTKLPFEKITSGVGSTTEEKSNFKRVDELKVDHYTSKNGKNKMTIDIYLDNHANEFDRDSVWRGLEGNLATTPSCLYQPTAPQKFEYVFHFLRGGKRVYLTLPLSYLCQRKPNATNSWEPL